MARPIPDMDQMTAAEVATDDSIIIDDTSAAETKRINVGDLLGLPKFGWTSAGEVWTYSSWNSTTRTGVFTVPSNATTKYTVGMRVMITQSTGGTKYGIIHAVASTSLTVFFPVGTTFNNETITNPYYSPLASPQGFDRSADKWSLESSLTTDGVLGGIATSSWYNINSHSVAYGVGAWKIYGKVSCGMDRGAGGRTDVVGGLSLSNTAPTNQKWIGGGATGNAGIFSANTFTISDDLVAASAGTLYWITSPSAASPAALYNFGAGLIGGARVIRLTSAYA